MALSNVELYEALKGPVGEDAARLIAEVVPSSQDLATKADIQQLRLEMSEMRGDIKASARDTMRWMLAFFVPVWVGTWGTVVAVLLKS